jgi:hypothetical protein
MIIAPCLLVVALLTPGPATSRPVPAATYNMMDELEAQLTAKPSSLYLGAEYRQLVIETGRYDRSLKLFERLSKDPRGGANRFLNLALA